MSKPLTVVTVYTRWIEKRGPRRSRSYGVFRWPEHEEVVTHDPPVVPACDDIVWRGGAHYRVTDRTVFLDGAPRVTVYCTEIEQSPAPNGS